MAINTVIKKMFSGSTPIVALFVLLLTSLYLMSDATHNSALFGQLYSLLLGINLLAIVLFIGLIGKSLWQLVQQYRQQIAGSRLTARLVIMFVILSVTPVSVVYYFSLDFLQRGIDSWFDVRVENALNDALELSKTSLGIRMSKLLEESEDMARTLRDTSDDVAALTLNDLRRDSEANELTLFNLNGRIIAASSIETEKLLPVQLDLSQVFSLQIEADGRISPAHSVDRGDSNAGVGDIRQSGADACRKLDGRTVKVFLVHQADVHHSEVGARFDL